MNVMVTRGAGYIGSVVTEELLRAGHTVVVYGNPSAGFRDAITPPATLVVGDLLDGAAMRAALEENAIDAVVHTRGLIAVGESMVHPEDFYRVNVQDGLSLLEAMLAAGVRKALGWSPVYDNLEAIVDFAWRWRQSSAGRPPAPFPAL